jgi:hypothetical protein
MTESNAAGSRRTPGGGAILPLVPKLHLGTLLPSAGPGLREIPFRADSIRRHSIKVGSATASTSAFPSATWERGNNAVIDHKIRATYAESTNF